MVRNHNTADTIQGRTKPYAQPAEPRTYQCKRCGCTRSHKGRKISGYCMDCATYARADGWI